MVSWIRVRVLYLDFLSLARPTAVVKLQLERLLDFRANAEVCASPVWSGLVRLRAVATGTDQAFFCQRTKKEFASDCFWYRTSAG